MKFLDLFSGIGGFRLAMQKNGHEPIAWIEKDKFARKSYEAIYDVKGEWTAKDVQNVEPGKIPDFDVLCAGFPCQDFSIAGKRKGLEGTRGTLFYEIARIAKCKKPQYLFLENVRGLLSHDEGKSFGIILKSLGKLGYDVEWQVLNSKHFGVPQNRKRVFIIGHNRQFDTEPIFPIRKKSQGQLKLEKLPNNKGKIHQQDKIARREGVMYCLNTAIGDWPLHGRIGEPENDYMRYLTPKKTWRLQGFPDWVFEKAKQVNSDTQLYKQAGNSVTVPVVEAIAEQLGD